MSTPPGSPAAGSAIPLASSYPIINHLTPRARRRETLKDQAERKKKENADRMKAAAAKRARHENDALAANAQENVATNTQQKKVRNSSKPPLPSSARSRAGAVASGVAGRGRAGPRSTSQTRSDGGYSSSGNKADAADGNALKEIKPGFRPRGRRGGQGRYRKNSNEVMADACEDDAADGEASNDAGAALSELTAILAELKAKLSENESTLRDSESRLQQTQQDLANEKELSSALSTSLDESRKHAIELQADIAQKTEEAAGLANDKAQLQEELAQANSTISGLKQDIVAHEQVQRGLRNTILELKGNIRVFARVRPTIRSEEQASIFSFPLEDPEKQHITATGEPKQSFDGRTCAAQSWDFKFDKVFHQRDDQEAVFSEVSHLIQSALDGYRVCIFAYGQTGSGKTYTMDGEDSTGPARGIIPRSVEHLFAQMEAQTEWDFELRATFLEIYNESIRDLAVASAPPDATYEIRHNHKTGETSVNGLHEVAVSSREDLHRLMEAARKARAVGATGSNERSSRSHSVFTLYATGTHKASGEKLRGVLNLVDLAGSERLASSKATGQQLKETQAINKSLSSLGDVIFALASGSKHVPFRNSKLTYLLQNSLGGNSKTLMFVNLSPANVNESLCSLRFGHKVNACDIGTAKTVKM